ncbi:MAG: histidinol-phosphatase [Clostridia bacterium]|nr:histidinol-phosphatase [Clostridia bacterium]
MIKSNFHTHTHFCDGLNSPLEMAEKAYSLNFISLGFSGHAHGDVEFYSMSKEDQKRYFAEISILKEKYKGKMEILCGLEMDLYSSKPEITPDYTIASVHYTKKNGEYLSVDESAESQAAIIKNYYNESFENYAEDYFQTLVTAVEKIQPDIIGHIDLLMKFCETHNIPETEKYLKIAEKYIKILCTFDVPFEINTGAMARGKRTTPYPSKNLLKLIKQYGGEICINSDCHNKDFLDFGYNDAENLAKACGFKYHILLSKEGRKKVNF